MIYLLWWIVIGCISGYGFIRWLIYVDNDHLWALIGDRYLFKTPVAQIAMMILGIGIWPAFFYLVYDYYVNWTDEEEQDNEDHV